MNAFECRHMEAPRKLINFVSSLADIEKASGYWDQGTMQGNCLRQPRLRGGWPGVFCYEDMPMLEAIALHHLVRSASISYCSMRVGSWHASTVNG